MARAPFDEWVLPFVRYRSTAGDLANAGIVLLLGAVASWAGVVPGGDGGRPLGQPWMPWVLAVACLVPLLLKRRLPTVSVATAGAILVVSVHLVSGSIAFVPTVAMFDALYAAALLLDARRMRVVLAIAVAVLAALAIAAPIEGLVAVILTYGALLGLPIAWGTSVRQRDALVRLERERADAVAHAAELDRTAAVRAERARLAAALHDEIAARLSAISLQTSALGARGGLDARTGASVEAVRTASREALAELRALISLLAADREEPALPPADDPVSALQRTADAFGVALRVASDRPPLAPDVSAALAQIGREAIVNAARHAPGAAVDASLHADGSVAVLEIDNPLVGAPSTVARGLGLDLMERRWSAIGARGSAGPVDARWRVRVEAPLSATAGTTGAPA
ncbi:sensor histidine kinase [Microbacterium sp. KNMS]